MTYENNIFVTLTVKDRIRKKKLEERRQVQVQSENILEKSFSKTTEKSGRVLAKDLILVYGEKF